VTQGSFDTDFPLAVRNLTVRYGRVVALAGVSLEIPRGALYVLLGGAGAGKSSLAGCLLGSQKPTSGEAFFLGRNPRWRPLAKLFRRLGVTGRIPPPELPKGEAPLSGLSRALGSRPEALVLDDPTALLDPSAALAFFQELARARLGGTTVLLLTSDPDGAARIATHVGILREGRLAVSGEIGDVLRRFRRIRYRNEVTEDRTAYGTELDAFDAVRVKVRGWGVEAVVSNFDEDAFAALAATEGVVDAEAEALSLREIFLAVAAKRPSPAGP
jgi:ABC-2 type transport system ATP-binding protein